MKKLIAFTLLGLAAWVNSLAQGNFTFNNSSTSLVWGDFVSRGTFVKIDAIAYVAVLWSTNLSALPTNYRNGLATPTNGLFVTTWSGIFTDPNFHLAQSTSGGNPIIVAPCGGSGLAAGTYFGGLQYIYRHRSG